MSVANVIQAPNTPPSHVRESHVKVTRMFVVPNHRRCKLWTCQVVTFVLVSLSWSPAQKNKILVPLEGLSKYPIATSTPVTLIWKSIRDKPWWKLSFFRAFDTYVVSDTKSKRWGFGRKRPVVWRRRLTCLLRSWTKLWRSINAGNPRF